MNHVARDRHERIAFAFLCRYIIYTLESLKTIFSARFRCVASMKKISINIENDSMIIKIIEEIIIKIKCARKKYLFFFISRCLRRKQSDSRVSNGNLTTTDTRDEIKLENSICYVSHLFQLSARHSTEIDR